MKILWVINIMLPAIADKLGLKASNREGWLSGAFESFSKNDIHELAIAFPTTDRMMINPFWVDNVYCYPFYEDLSHPEEYDGGLDESFRQIISDFNPDILHIFGTEFPHGLSAASVYGKPEKTLVGMQGVCTAIARDYFAMIPDRVVNSVTFRDFIRKDSIKDQQRKFECRAENESKLLKLCSNVTGRTDFDKKETLKINKDRVYFHMNETMRNEFYEGKWNYRGAVPYSIFLGQGDYPIKGMHFLLKAAGMLIEKYPDLHIFIAGNSIIEHKNLKDIIKTPAYGRYLRKLIKKNKLDGKVTALGNLTAGQIKERYLKSSVFVCPSYVENSPNTIAEAMLLGVPLVASDAGGITSVISEKEGIIVKRGDVNSLALAIEKVFNDEEVMSEELVKRCEDAITRAHNDYNKDNNLARMLDIYEMINNGSYAKESD